MVLPVSPSVGSYQDSALGPVGQYQYHVRHSLMRYSYMMWSVQGIATSGAFFYNHKDGNNQVAASTEGETFDTCMGHADPMCRYHYHKAPVCIPSSCSVIGYLRDGVPVYGICDVEGQRLKSCYRLRLILNQRYNTDRLPEATKILSLKTFSFNLILENDHPP